MAGREHSGIHAAEMGLFEGCTYCLIPGTQESSKGVAQLSEIVTKLGAHPFVVDAERHDHLVAGISHLPFVLSCALTQCLSKSDDWNELQILAAGGFRDMSRLAAGSPTMYRDICTTNQVEILDWLDAMVSEMNKIRSLISQNDEAVQPYFTQAKQIRDTVFS